MLWGERDRTHRKTDPESLRSLVPHARIVRLAESGHCPHLEEPDAFVAALDQG
jgi:pimeloyl-ACP methyl ester carboxylesterase